MGLQVKLKNVHSFQDVKGDTKRGKPFFLTLLFFVKDFRLEAMRAVDIKPVKEAKMTTMLEIMLKNASNGNIKS